MAKFVRIKHPRIEGTAEVAERYFLRSLKDKGWELADTQPAQPAVDHAPEDGRPQKNDKTEAWRSYATDVRGMDPDEAASMGRDELVAYFDALEA